MPEYGPREAHLLSHTALSDRRSAMHSFNLARRNILAQRSPPASYILLYVGSSRDERFFPEMGFGEWPCGKCASGSVVVSKEKCERV